MNCAEANQMDLVEYLHALGYQPEKIRNNDYWYLSPLRDEKTPSFKVNKTLNQWYDHGTGKGGNLIDFALLYHHCPLHEILQKLENNFSFHQHKFLTQTPSNADEKGHIKVADVREINAAELVSYLTQRKIPVDVATTFCKEADFTLYDKKHTAIGLINNSGGYELRSSNFKGSSSPKTVTTINNHSQEINVFEGLFSFLSFQTLTHKTNPPLTNFLILNSLAFFEKSRQVMEQHKKVNLYLDRDEAGIKCMQKALEWNIKFINKSNFYRNYKDLNDYLVDGGLQQKKGLGLRKHL